MSLREISKTVTACRRLVVSGTQMQTGFPLHAPNGLPQHPSYSFAGAPRTGLYVTSRGDLTAAVDGNVVVSVDSRQNVYLFATPTEHSGTSGLYFGAVTVMPTEPIESGGFIFVRETSMYYMTTNSTEVPISRFACDVIGPSLATTNSLVQFANADGKIIKASTLMNVNTSLQVPATLTASTPSYSFLNDSTTGMYNAGAGALGFSVDGTERLLITTAGVATDALMLFSGSATLNLATITIAGHDTALTLSYDSDVVVSVRQHAIVAFGANPVIAGSGSGFVYVHPAVAAPTSSSSDGILMWTTASALMMMTESSTVPIDLTRALHAGTGASDQAVARFDGSSGTEIQTSSVTITDVDDVIAGPGTEPRPTYSFAETPSTGVYSGAPGSINFTVQGTSRLSVTNEAIITNRLRSASGTAAAPGMARRGDPDTGFYLSNGTSCAVSCAGEPCVVVSPGANVSLAGAEAVHYGDAQGVVFINQATVNPTRAAGCGLLFIDAAAVNSLVFTDATGISTVLTNRICGPPSALDRQVARFEDSRGQILGTAPAFITPSGEFLAASLPSLPTYSFSGDTTTGFTMSASTLRVVTGGVTTSTLTASVLTTQTLTLPTGNVAEPTLSFTLKPTTGLCQPVANTVCFVNDAAPALTVTASNITLGSQNVDYGSGDRVVLIESVDVVPTGAAARGGRVYVDDAALMFHDVVGANLHLGRPFIPIIDSAVQHAVVRFTSAGNLQPTPFLINDTTALDYPYAGSHTAPTFSFTSDATTGLYWLDNQSLALAVGGTQCFRADATAAVVPTAALNLDASVHVGDVTMALSANDFSQDISHASGSFSWQQNNTPIFSTSSSRNLVLQKLRCTNGTTIQDLTHTGSSFDLRLPDKLSVVVGAETQANFQTNLTFIPVSTVTVDRLYVGTSSIPTTYFDYDTSTAQRGLHRDTSNLAYYIAFGSTRPLYFYKNSCISLGGGNSVFGSASRVMFIYDVASVPSSSGSNCMILFNATSASVFGIGARTTDNKLSIFDAARECATITRTLTIASALATNLDTSSWTVAFANGVNGTTTGLLSFSDDCFVTMSVAASWQSNSVGHRQLSVMRKTGAVYTTVGSVSTMAVSGETTTQEVKFFGTLVSGTDALTVQVYQNSSESLDVSITVSVVRYETHEV